MSFLVRLGNVRVKISLSRRSRLQIDWCKLLLSLELCRVLPLSWNPDLFCFSYDKRDLVKSEDDTSCNFFQFPSLVWTSVHFPESFLRVLQWSPEVLPSNLFLPYSLTCNGLHFSQVFSPIWVDLLIRSKCQTMLPPKNARPMSAFYISIPNRNSELGNSSEETIGSKRSFWFGVVDSRTYFSNVVARISFVSHMSCGKFWKTEGSFGFRNK